MNNPYKHLKTEPEITGYPYATDFNVHTIWTDGTYYIQVLTAMQGNIYTSGIKIDTVNLERVVYPSLRNGGFKSEKYAILYAIGVILESSEFISGNILCEIHNAISRCSQTELF